MNVPCLSYPKSSISPVNRAYIVDCLPRTDSFSARINAEDVLDEVVAQDPAGLALASKQVTHLVCADKDAYGLALEAIRTDALVGGRPLLFIHGHGDKERGLKLASGDFIGWRGYLDGLEAVTQAAGGEVTVLAAFCYSMEIVSHLPKTGRLPFAFYYGYDHEVSQGILQEEAAILYRSFLRDGGQTAFEKSLSLACYSEYDHVAPVIATALLLGSEPSLVAQKVPTLSKRQLRRHLESALASGGHPLSGAGTIFKQVLRSKEFLEQTVSEFMYDTKRRSEFLQAALRWSAESSSENVADGCCTAQSVPDAMKRATNL